MYWNVPTIVPSTVSGRLIVGDWLICPPDGASPASRARPKSRSLAPAQVSMMFPGRSEEHTSELQSRLHLVCRLLLEKKKTHRQSAKACNVSCAPPAQR